MDATAGARSLDAAAIEALRTGFRGEVVTPADGRYDAARTIYNAMIDKRPALIARCVDVADVITALRFGRKHDLDVGIQCGGHSGPGLGLVDGGLTIDLSPIRWVRVDPEARIAHVVAAASSAIWTTRPTPLGSPPRPGSCRPRGSAASPWAAGTAI